MVKRVFLDIETIPTRRADEFARIRKEQESKNAALKKPHPAEEVEAKIAEEVAKTALDGAAGQVVVICAAIDDGPVISWWDVAEERTLLTRFADEIAQALDGHAAIVVGHNVNGFDKPFLRQRAMVCGVHLPAWLTRAEKPWDAAATDTMLMWTGGAPGKFIGLDRLARALGVGEKSGDIDGANVWQAIKDGRIAEVRDYCALDVELARLCFHRMNPENF